MWNGRLPCCKTYPRTFIEFGNNFTSCVTTKIKTTTKTTIENVAKYADQTSNASDKTEEIGIGMAVAGSGASMVAPEAGVPEGTAATGLALAGFSKTVGTGADLVSFTAKWIDVGFGGSKTAALNQTMKVSVDFGVGKVLSVLVPESMQSKLKSVVMSTFKEATDMKSKQIIYNQLGIK